MDELSLGEHLRYLRELAHENPVVETPPTCQALWERARADSFHLGCLYVLRRPLSAGVGGAYEPASGDIWVLHDPARPDDSARILLHELAHAQHRSSAPAADIDAYCDEEAATEERARALAAAWGVAELFRDADLRDTLVEIEELRARLYAAGKLAGSLDPTVARRAAAALVRLAGEAGWTQDVLDDALFGIADETANARALDFGRCALRSRWRLGWGESVDFGRLALSPEETSGDLLRSALGSVAEGRLPGDDAFVERAVGVSNHYRFAFLRLEGWHDLAPVLAAANAALLAHQDEYALAMWDCFGDAADTRAQRLYRLWLRYGANDRSRQAPPEAQLWVLAMPRRERDLRVEAAFQQYILGWRAHTALAIDEWWRGMYELAEHLQTAR